MKKKIFLFIMLLLFFPAMFLFAGCSADRDILIRVSGEYVQWSYQGENLWHDLIDTSSIKAMLGETYKGDKGEQGLQGAQGIAGKQVEFRRTEQNIEWHYVGEDTWHILISVEELKTDTSQDSNPQQLAFYPLDDGTYGVGVGNATELSSITIPETYLGKPVTKIVDGGFGGCGNLKDIDIPNSVTYIGYSAFYNCDLLKSVFIPSSVTIIEEEAFFHCDLLTEIIVSENLQYLGKGAFSCRMSERDYPYYIYEFNTNLSYNSSRGIKYLGNDINPYLIVIGVENYNSSTYIIDDNAKFIYNAAFAYCASMNCITLPTSLIDIGSFAFYNCRSLEEITIHRNIERIGVGSFSNCASLSSVIFEDINGWTLENKFLESSYIDISCNDLNNNEIAARYLIETYKSYCWVKVS